MVWTVIGSSVRGTSHERRSQPCQDAWAWREISHDTAGNHLCVAVADGAGSASHSDLGAETAVTVVVEAVTQLIRSGSLASGANSEEIDLGETSLGETKLEQWRSPLINILQTVQAELTQLATHKNLPLRELACTLLIMVWTPAGIVALQVGDGAIIGRGRSGEFIALTQPHQGEYANQTVFAIEEQAADHAQFIHWSDPLSHVALFSDGLQRLALELPSGKPFAPFFEPLMTFLDQVHGAALDDTLDNAAAGDRSETPQEAIETLNKFLRSPRVTARTDDDLTLALITRST